MLIYTERLRNTTVFQCAIFILSVSKDQRKSWLLMIFLRTQEDARVYLWGASTVVAGLRYSESPSYL